MSERAPTSAGPGRSAWRWFPFAVTGAIALVIAVNAGMVWRAVATFPGAALNDRFGGDDDDSFTKSNDYNRILTAVDRQNARGWSVATEGSGSSPVLRLADRRDQPLLGATVLATAIRPLGAPETTELRFHPAGPGRYVADAPLAHPGQWDLMLRVARDRAEIRVTRRVVVR
jgi:nitrogen fixation protein FixH